MNTQEIYDVLTSLGYKLHDRGSYWQTSAVFRNGDNQTALQIYKDTGVWRDFVSNTPPLKFERLVEKSLGKDSDEFKKLVDTKKFLNLTKQTAPPPKKLQMEEIYPEDSLKKLLPHYRFYNDRGIDDPVLKKLKCGLATQGRMYQRLVFPIYNEFEQIHGYSGRDMLNKPNRPKWKHVGRKSHWVYPAYVNPFFLSSLEEADYVILVESIGDLLAFHQQGHYNVLVSFGLDISPALISVLVQFNPSKIILSFNNDSESNENRGLTGSLKSYLKLLSFFDYQKLFICLPMCNDFGDMDSKNFEKWITKVEDLDPSTHYKKVLEHSKSLVQNRQLSKKLIKNRKLLAAFGDE